MILEEHMTPGKKGRGRKYSLYAICNHRGTPSKGHYTACCRANESHDKLDPKPRRAWYFFDDHVVKRVDRFKNTREAHILFYRTQEA